MTALKVRSRSRASMLSGVGVGAMAMALLASPALAQTQSSTVDEIVVTGVRASVGSALQLKKTATQLQDSIVAEDIGKLPDNNVVEALQHVSGISIVRNSVEPSVVLVRGLPDIATTLNGRQIFTSAGRFVSLPDLPAELLAKVDVKKSSSANDLEGGIAGLIDVTLHRPSTSPSRNSLAARRSAMGRSRRIIRPTSACSAAPAGTPASANSACCSTGPITSGW